MAHLGEQFLDLVRGKATSDQDIERSRHILPLVFTVESLVQQLLQTPEAHSRKLEEIALATCLSRAAEDVAGFIKKIGELALEVRRTIQMLAGLEQRGINFWEIDPELLEYVLVNLNALEVKNTDILLLLLRSNIPSGPRRKSQWDAVLYLIHHGAQTDIVDAVIRRYEDGIEDISLEEIC